MKIYLAGPMRGIPQFNFPAFHAAAAKLKAQGHEVFNPAARDEDMYGSLVGTSNATGDPIEAEQNFGLTIREALAADMKFICEEAEAIAMLPGWKKSKGATAEHATATALGLKVIWLEE